MTLQDIAQSFRNMGDHVREDMKMPYLSSELKAYMLGVFVMCYMAADCIDGCIIEKEAVI